MAKFHRALEAMLSIYVILKTENHCHFSDGREATCQSVFGSTWAWPERVKGHLTQSERRGLRLGISKQRHGLCGVTWLKSEIPGLGKGLVASWALFVDLFCLIFRAEGQTWPSVCVTTSLAAHTLALCSLSACVSLALLSAVN